MNDKNFLKSAIWWELGYVEDFGACSHKDDIAEVNGVGGAEIEDADSQELTDFICGFMKENV